MPKAVDDLEPVLGAAGLEVVGFVDSVPTSVQAQRCERAGEVLEERHLTAKTSVTTRRKTSPEVALDM